MVALSSSRWERLTEAEWQRLRDDEKAVAAEYWWGKINGPGYLEDLLSSAPRNFCALECLANDPAYAKTDRRKRFLLWEVSRRRNDGIQVDCDTRMKKEDHRHHWVYALFVGDNYVRFPFNYGDTDATYSLSPWTINLDLPTFPPIYELQRWSTASRSCLTLIPTAGLREGAPDIPRNPANPWKPVRTAVVVAMEPGMEDPHRYLIMSEWVDESPRRFYEDVDDVGYAASHSTYFHGSGTGQLYSIKTGVYYVGSMNEARAHKDRLETNCALAMERSKAIEAYGPLNDDSFGIETEVLTITAPCQFEEGPSRDGFQVRDLSCMRPGLDFIPGQAIPYAREAFDNLRVPPVLRRPAPEIRNLEPRILETCEFWRKNFAVPLGRAKARLFLNFGLIHTSANAQNFILGFNKGTHELAQFVLRDIGDTSWHDTYITTHLWIPQVFQVYKAYWNEQRAAPSGDTAASGPYHLLTQTSSTQYPPPHIVRLDANAVLTHGFADVLRNKQSWTDEHVYRFATGILDGFRDFMTEALSLELVLPRLSHLEDGFIKECGVLGKYPYREQREYLRLLGRDEISQLAPVDLFSKADQVRERGKVAVTRKEDREFFRSSEIDDCICTLLNAEELLLCAAFDKYLMSEPPCKALRERLVSGDWPRVVRSEPKEQVHK